MQNRLELIRGSVTGKVLFIGALTLLLLIPMAMIQGLIMERASMYETARRDIANGWGDAQTVGAPILIVPFEHTQLVYSPTSQAQLATVKDELYVLPEDFAIAGRIDVTERARGIYEVPVYTAELALAARFAPPSFDRGYRDLEIRWDQAEIALPLSDARSIKDPVVLRMGEAAVQFQAGGERVRGFGPQLVARFADLGLGSLETPQSFSIDLAVGGTSAFRMLPLGDATRASLSSNWASPSFRGAYLPESSSMSDTDGFDASWRMLALGRGFPASWQKSQSAPNVTTAAFGVDLITPVGVHQSSLRAAKYAVLFIGLTFTAYFLFELFAGLRLHALQYLLIGFANCVFYLLLLAFAEHVGFTSAYVVSAAAATTLIAAYSAAVLRSLRRAVPIAALLGMLYAYLYVTLRAEDYALLFGALGLFAVLATFMYLTRRIDWYAVRLGSPPPSAESPV